MPCRPALPHRLWDNWSEAAGPEQQMVRRFTLTFPSRVERSACIAEYARSSQ